MKSIKIGEKYTKYNSGTFFKDIEGFEEVVYVGEDASVLKSIVIAVRTAKKSFVYVGRCDSSFMLRKVPGAKVFKTLDEFEPKKINIEKMPSDEDEDEDVMPSVIRRFL